MGSSFYDFGFLQDWGGIGSLGEEEILIICETVFTGKIKPIWWVYDYGAVPFGSHWVLVGYDQEIM
ncbi:MAG: hypothetical protein JST58_18145 [Bacteroidetes bacterium]|nr:hypothetical protein [Bacteroidota bacterium]